MNNTRIINEVIFAGLKNAMLEEHLNIPTNSGFSMETINHDIRNKNTN
jgi:hypothetical protein